MNDCVVFGSSMYQQNSWTAFSISEKIFRTIFAAYCVHPFFLNHVHSFGSKNGLYDIDLFGSYVYRIEPDWSLGDVTREPFYGKKTKRHSVISIVVADVCRALLWPKLRPEERERDTSVVY